MCARNFLLLELEARVVAATMIELGIGEINQTRSMSTYVNMENMSNQAKMDSLNSLATKVVDTYILRKEKVETILQKTCKAQDLQKCKDAGERFPCRFPGCSKSFKHNGKRQRDHEKTHGGGFVAGKENETSATTCTVTVPNVAKNCDMFSY